MNRHDSQTEAGLLDGRCVCELNSAIKRLLPNNTVFKRDEFRVSGIRQQMTKGAPRANYRTVAVVNHRLRSVSSNHPAGRLCTIRQSLVAVQNDASSSFIAASDHDAAAKS